MSQEVTKNSEQEIANRSFDNTYQVEMAEAVGYDADNAVLRPVAVDGNGVLKVTI